MSVQTSVSGVLVVTKTVCGGSSSKNYCIGGEHSPDELRGLASLTESGGVGALSASGLAYPHSDLETVLTRASTL